MFVRICIYVEMPKNIGFVNMGSQQHLMWVVVSGVISPLIWVISIVTLLITLLITTLNPKP